MLLLLHVLNVSLQLQANMTFSVVGFSLGHSVHLSRVLYTERRSGLSELNIQLGHTQRRLVRTWK